MEKKAVVKELLRTGKIFTVVFTKKDGTERTLTGRTGVHKNLKDAGLSWNPEERGYLIVYDFIKKDYRVVNLEAVKEIHYNGAVYAWKEGRWLPYIKVDNKAAEETGHSPSVNPPPVPPCHNSEGE